MLFGSDVQFGHAGASANADAETAIAKNKALRDAGFIVPDSFDGLSEAIKTTYDKLPKRLQCEEGITEDPITIANELNKHFVSKRIKLAEKLPSTNK